MKQIKEKSQLKLGICLILISAFMTATGQLLWKISMNGEIITLLIGFCLYGLGAIIMTVAFKFGDISILHPMLGFSLVMSIIYGGMFLHEQITIGKILGVILILFGLIILGIYNKLGREIQK